MFENELQTRCAICGTGILLGLVFVFAGFPLILLTLPITILFLGIVADPDEMHDIDGRRVYPRMPGIHTVQIRTGRRKWAQIGRARDFSPENGGYTSPVFEIRIAGGGDV